MSELPLWKRVQRELRHHVDADELATWFSPLKARVEGRRLLLEAPDVRFLNTLEEAYRSILDSAINAVAGPSYQVRFVLTAPPIAAARTSAAARPATSRRRTGVAAASDDELPPPAFNPRYVFETFVVGKSNEFAHAAARTVSERPSESYNPLFLYGGVGLGKTHLLHAIGHGILETRPDLRIAYLTAEQFVNELITSIRFDRMPEFRERYRTIDVLLVDDVQFLANKERTQEEFFHTFNTLYTGQKQIIFSSDSSPRQIPTLEERLRSRFEWGLIADIQPPELETKMAILRRKADLADIELPNEVAEFIARQVRSSVRELEGLLNRVLAYASLTDQPVTLDLARDTLKDILSHPLRTVSKATILRHVAKHYELTEPDLRTKKTNRRIAFARQVAMYLLKNLTDLSYLEIGSFFADKHHSTVMYAVDKIDQLRESDADLDRMIEDLIARIESGNQHTSDASSN